MRSSRVPYVSVLCAAVLAACGGGSDPPATQAGADTVASVDLKSRRSREASEPAGGTAGGTSSGGTGTTGTGTTSAVPAGRLLASNCFNCHGTDGHPNGGFDSLAGDSASEIVKSLKELAAKSPEDGGIMRAHARGYTDEQMWQIGSYFASRR